VHFGVNKQIINVDDDVGDAPKHSLYETLKTGRAAEKPHRRGDPLVLSMPGNGEGSKWL